MLLTDKARTRLLAPAKVNLALHVTGRRADGYHLLDSVVAFAEVGDFLTLTPAERISIEVSGAFAGGVPTDQRNLLWRAAQMAGWSGHVALEKCLPHGAGIGGGSADAAALLRAVGAAEDGLALGSDVPVCKLSRAARMTGIGEGVSPLDGFPPLPALLVNPGVYIATPDVFAALERADHPALAPLPTPGASAGEWMGWLGAQRNDLEEAAIGTAPIIGEALADLRATKDAQVVRMSGSGATCFALYPTMKAAHLAAYELGAARTDWWAMPTRLS